MVVGVSGQFNTVDDFVGTDLWVRARVRHKCAYSYSYIKVLSSGEETTEHGFTYKVYTILELDIRYLSRSDVYHCKQSDKDYKLQSKGMTIPGYDIKLLEPIDIATTDEMFHLIDAG